jgi:hypothetical protein
VRRNPSYLLRGPYGPIYPGPMEHDRGVDKCGSGGSILSWKSLKTKDVRIR